jgi:hypothetical protein
MSKKKQFTGKKTKLANLPLTKVLSRKMEEAEDHPSVLDLPGADKQLPLSWESLEEGAAGLLAAAYLLILQDLVSLQAEFLVPPGKSPEVHAIPVNLPPMPYLKQALRQTREELSDLVNFLA